MRKKIDLGQIGAPTTDSKPTDTTKGKVSFSKNPIPRVDGVSALQSDENKNGVLSIDVSNSNGKLFGPKNKQEFIKDQKKKRRNWKKFIIIFFVILIASIGAFLGIKAYQAFNDLKQGGVDVSIGDLIGNVVNKKKDPQLLKDGNLTNTLFVGIDSRSAGTSGDGLENTDSIMIASFNHDTKKLTFISIPRDNNAVFKVGKDNKTLIKNYRINAAYAVAQDYNYQGGGLALLRQTLTEMTGLQIQYTAQINFKAFKDVIDRLGGITVNVERSFTDYEYPNDNDTGIITVSFKTGEQTMNGTKALQFARSRHSGDNGEGSDFMRARRQQKILAAIADKLKTTNFVTDPNALFDFVNIFGTNVKIQKTETSNAAVTNIDFNDLSAVLALKDKVNPNDNISVVLDPTIGGLNNILIRLDTDAYMIGPKLGVGKYDELKRYVSFVSQTPDLYNENKPGLDSKNNKQYAEIGFVDNGLGYANTITEVAKLDKDYISSSYMAVLKNPIVLNPSVTGTPTPLAQIGIYDVSQKKPITKEYLKKRYSATELTAEQVPDSIKKLDKDYDLILFLIKKN